MPRNVVQNRADRRKERERGAIVQKSAESRARFVQSAMQCKTEGAVEELLYKIRCAKSCAIQSGAHCKKEEAKCNAVQNRAEREREARLKRRSFSNGSHASFDAP